MAEPTSSSSPPDAPARCESPARGGSSRLLEPAELSGRLRPVKLLCLDVDGVLTDGNLYWSDGGGWSQRFSVRDGFGIKLLQSAGVEVAILSGGDLKAGRARAESLAIRHAYFGVADKVEAWRELAERLGVSLQETAYVGDELIDLPLLRLVGFGATVPEAVDEVLEAAHYVTRRPAGAGAVREICDLVRRHAAVVADPLLDGNGPAADRGPGDVGNTGAGA